MEERSRSPYRWVVFGTVNLVYLLVFSQRTMPGLISLQIIRDFGISASVLGMVSSIQFFLYMLLQVPVGILGDRYGPELFLLLGGLLDGLGTVGFALAGNVASLFVARAMVGLGDALIWVNLVLLFSRWFTPGEYLTILALTMTAAGTGTIATMYPVSVWLAHTDWRVPFMTVGIALLLAGGAMKIALTKVPAPLRQGKTGPHAPAGARRGGEKPFHALRDVLRQKSLWPLFLGHFSIIGVYTGFLAAWAVPYLTVTCRTTRLAASGMVTVVLVGNLCGGPAVSMAKRCFRNEAALYFWSNAVCVAGWTAFFLAYPHTDGTLLYAALFVTGFGAGTGILSFSLVRRIFRPATNGVASGVVNTGGFLGAVLLPVVFGLVLERFSGAAGYGPQAFHAAMTVPLLFSLFGLAGSAILWKSRVPAPGPAIPAPRGCHGRDATRDLG